jgi:hypothetical protein
LTFTLGASIFGDSVNAGSPVQLNVATGIKGISFWYAATLDAAYRAQIGRILVTTTTDQVLDCGDKDLPLGQYDYKVEGPDSTRLGSLLMGVVAASSTNAKGDAISITSLSFLVLLNPVKAITTIDDPPVKMTDYSAPKLFSQSRCALILSNQRSSDVWSASAVPSLLA